MSLLVHRAGLQCLVQDLGRPGWAHLGVPRAGALDPPAAALANRLVGNPTSAAVLEVLLGGLEVEADVDCVVALTGASVAAHVDRRPVDHLAPVRLPAGSRLALGAPGTGLRTYVAVAGGLDVPAVLGSRSTDTLARVGPAPVRDGDVLGVGVPAGPPAPVDVPRLSRPGPLRIAPGPRADWLVDALDVLCGSPWAVRGESDRVGMRLDGPALQRARGGELASEGMVLGAVQVPPDGRPVVFLADHPATGGYPVVAVVRTEDLWQCAQLRPGEPVRFSRR